MSCGNLTVDGKVRFTESSLPDLAIAAEAAFSKVTADHMVHFSKEDSLVLLSS